MRLTRSLLFDLWLYASMAILGLLFAPLALASRGGAIWAMRVYCRLSLWMLARLCGLRVEIRGPVPATPCLVVAKHQSFLDVLILMRTLPQPRFVMKRSLIWAPILGLYALRIGAVAIDRSDGPAAMRQLKARLAAERDAQIVIYPQGSRVAPDATPEDAPYKPGAALLARLSGLPSVPAATNAGLFWSRRSLIRRPGLAVLEFLDPLPSDLPARAYAAEVETRIEAASAALLREARAAEPAPLAAPAPR